MRPETPLIIGAGPAGSAAAIVLARGGAKPLILEAARETGDALCGGFLSWRPLERFGISTDRLGGHRVTQVRLMSRTQIAEPPLPGGAGGVSRLRLDTLLNAQVEAAGARIERGVSVRMLEADGAISLKDGARLTPESLLIATGKHELRGLRRARLDAPTLGLRIRLGPHPALTKLVSDTIELHLFEGGYAGLVLQEDGSANLCMALRKDVLADAGGVPLHLLEELGRDHPRLGERLAYMATDPQIDSISAIPYGWFCNETVPGRFRLGDQAACIPSSRGRRNRPCFSERRSGGAGAALWRAGRRHPGHSRRARIRRAGRTVYEPAIAASGPSASMSPVMPHAMHSLIFVRPRTCSFRIGAPALLTDWAWGTRRCRR